MRTYLALVGLLLGYQNLGADELIPITTSSSAARASYLQARELFENLRNADARADLQAAVAADPEFALAWLGLAQASTSAQEFFDSVERAVNLVDNVSPGERLWIEGFDAGVKGLPETQRQRYIELAALHEADPRAHNLLGTHHFGQQNWQAASDAFDKATQLAPDFSPPYNMLGYARRFAGDVDGAEAAFQKYIELIPSHPNPYDSYAELLMKTGRFEASIVHYRKALELDRHFQASARGIATNLNLLDRHAEAQAELQRVLPLARNDGERRGVWFAMAVSLLDEGRHEAAIAAIGVELALAARIDDAVAMAGDYTNIATIHLEAGDVEPAEAHFAAALAVVERSDRDDRVKDNWRRGDLYNRGTVAAARGDLPTARELAAQLLSQSETIGNSFGTRLAHQLQGIVALAAGDGDTALAELALANQQNPANMLRQARAASLQGDQELSTQWLRRTVEFNALNNLNFSLVRRQARAELARP
jgi:tetratricopeptide (TPR) repeat protein